MITAADRRSHPGREQNWYPISKITFQRCIEDYYRGDESAIDDAAIKAVKKYSKALAEHFVNAERGRWIYGYSAAIGGAA